MKKRVVSLLLCLIMALSLIPTAAFATEGVDADSAPADEVQVQEQAATDEVAVQWGGGGQPGGGGHGGGGWVDPNNPEANQKYYNKDANVYYVEDKNEDDHVTAVTLGDKNVPYNSSAAWGNNGLKLSDAYGNNVTSTNEGTATLKITPDDGYYVTKVYIACVDNSNNAYSCHTYAAGKAYDKTFDVTDGTNVSVSVKSKYFGHSSNSLTYYIVISTAKCPEPVYVGYDAGTAGTTKVDAAPVVKTGDGWLTDYYTQKYDVKQSTHTVLNVSDAAKDAANGYTFTGWKVHYYRNYDPNTNTFSDELTNYTTTISAAEIGTATIKLNTYAQLVAQWEEVENPTGSLTIEKKFAGELPQTSYPNNILVNVTGPNDYSYNVPLSAENDWKATLDGLTPGTYKVNENTLSAKVDNYTVSASYSVGNTPLGNGNSVEVNANKTTVTVTVTNTYTKDITVYPTLTVTKIDREDESKTLSGATFVLKANDGTLIATATDNGNGTYTFSNVNVSAYENQNVYLYETVAPSGYITPSTYVYLYDVSYKESIEYVGGAWVTSYKWKLNHQDAVNTTIKNDKDYGDPIKDSATITIKKSDENGKPLTGAEFALSLGTTKTLISKDNNDGTYTISGIDTEGAWTLSETKAPERHQKTDKTWTVNVTKALKGEELNQDGKYQKVYEYSADSVMFEVTNNRWYADEVINPATLTIYKSDSKVATKMLEGAKFTLTQGTTVLESEDKGNGVYTISGINNIGNWTLTETTAPQGYVLPTEGWTINVSKSLTFNEVEIDDNGVKKYQKVYTYETNQPDDTMFIKNSAMGALTISKELKGDLVATDFDKPFSFTVLMGTTEVKTIAVWPGNPVTLTLAPGRYTIVENNADVDGYKLTTSFAPNYIVEVKAGEEITVVATNTYEQITGTVTINKVLKGLNATDFTDGFAFDIKDASGKVVATVDKVFPNAAQPTTVTLAPGKYTIVEKSADVKDYDLTTDYDKQTFTVEADKNVTVTVTNTYTKQVTPPPAEYTLSVDIQKNIELKRSSSRKPGKASFTFEAYLVDGNGKETILDTVTIDTKGTKSADGKLTFTLTEDDLSITSHGIVYVREVKGDARGWTYDDTVYMLGVGLTMDGELNIISVDRQRVDKPVTLEFTNVYYKRSSTTTGGDDKPIQSVKTGDMGIAMYAMTSLLSLGGAALVIKKRKEEK